MVLDDEMTSTRTNETFVQNSFSLGIVKEFFKKYSIHNKA